MSLPLFAALVTLTNLFGSVSVDTHGARIVSYVPKGGSEVFATFRDGTGGMPICAPWFASLGPVGGRRHGVARYQDFTVVRLRENGDMSSLELETCSDEATRREFPYDYKVSVALRLGRTLSVALHVHNAGCEPMPVSLAFHPYFRVGDAPSCHVTGVGAEALPVLPGPSHVYPFPTDRRTFALVDPVLGRTLEFVSGGDRQIAIWTPGESPSAASRAKTTSTFAPGEWRGFVAVENGLLSAENIVQLKPGGTYILERTIREVGASPCRRFSSQEAD